MRKSKRKKRQPDDKPLICSPLLTALLTHLTVSVIAYASNNINTNTNTPNPLSANSHTQHTNNNNNIINSNITTGHHLSGSINKAPGHESASNSNADFERLLERILRPIQLLSRPSMLANPDPGGLREGVAADPNNRTSMRFFRNNKTFASIVYMNGGDLSSSGRRLINCHLVDLEKHSSDVALFEAKYEMRTVDIEFRDMMQLIEACTNIARPKNPPRLNIAQPGSTGSAGSQPNTPKRGPLLVVGRPGDATPPLLGTKSGVDPRRHKRNRAVSPPSIRHQQPGSLAHQQQQQQQQQHHGNRYHQQQHQHQPHHGKLQPTGARHPQIHTSYAHEQVANALVLGEVTPPPSLNEGNGPGLREAIHEITSYDSSDLFAIWRGIMPGTNWCGMGDRATSYNDLGFEADIDICCRAHDFCPIRLSAFSSGYGLFNWSFYTRSHCWCDQNFLDCLQRSSSPLSAVVTRFYFNIMKTTCLHDNQTLAATGTGTPSGSSNQLVGQLTGADSSRASWHAVSAPLQQQQQRLLLDQIRGAMPIPALKQSQALRSRLDYKHHPNHIETTGAHSPPNNLVVSSMSRSISSDGDPTIKMTTSSVVTTTAASS